MNWKLFHDFKLFCGPYIACGDIDPVYPVLKNVHNLRGWSPRSNEAIWHTFLYFVWYHLGSAEKWLNKKYLRAYNKTDTGIERRGFRGEVGTVKANLLIDHVLVTIRNTALIFYDDYFKRFPTWQEMFQEVMSWPQCGTWAAYKWCDLMKNVHDYNISAPDIGYGGGGENAGPIPGMVKLTGCNWKECANNISLQRELFDTCIDEGIPLAGMEQMETALCDFNSMINGHYYIGHDLDKQMEHITSIPGNDYWKARELSFPKWALGEENGYFGVRKYLLNYYRQNGTIFIPS